MNTWIVLLLIFSIIALGCIILAYFGVFRKLMINLKEPEDYIQTYHNLDRLESKIDNYRFVISLATTPEDISKMKPVISSLLDQTVKVDEICINIPPDAAGIIPDYMEKCLRVYKINKDYGPSNNIIPVINREKNAKTVLIALENDVVYGKDFIERFTKHLTNIKYGGGKYYSMATDMNNGVAGGSIVTLVGRIDPDVVNIDQQSDDVYTHPEKWITQHIKGDIFHFKYTENYNAFISTKRNYNSN